MNKENKPFLPKVSICIPVYNGAHLIERALKSCIAQTYPNIEVVISDDCSSDNIAAVVESFRPQIKNLIYNRNEKNIGLIPNFFQNLKIASGEFIQIVGQDDWISDNYIEEIVHCFQKLPTAGVVSTKLISVFRNGEIVSPDTTINFPDGVYSSEYIAKNIYRNKWGSANLFCGMRRKDLLAVESILIETMTDPKFGEWYRRGFVSDWLIFLEVISNYKFITMTNNASYTKSVHFLNEGKKMGFLPTSFNGTIDFYESGLRCLSSIYQKKFKKELFWMRVYYGFIMLGSLVINSVKYFSREFFEGGKIKKISHFFSGYTPIQFLFVFFLAPFSISFRFFDFLIRSSKRL